MASWGERVSVHWTLSTPEMPGLSPLSLPPPHVALWMTNCGKAPLLGSGRLTPHTQGRVLLSE